MNMLRAIPRQEAGCPRPSRLSMRKILILAGLVVAQLPMAHAKDYYLDSSVSVDGTGTYENPWKSIKWNSGINTTVFSPGDRILFRKGKIFTGQVKFATGWYGGTSEATRVILDSYEKPGDPDIKPILAGAGIEGATLEINNKRYITIQNLEITNWPADPTVEGSSPAVRFGIRVQAYSPETWQGITIRNNTIRKIRGITGRGGLYGNAAIYPTIADTSYTADANGNILTGARWENFLIENNDISDSTCIGIYFKDPVYYKMEDTARWGTNVRVIDNTFQNMGADHIVLNGVDGALVENNKGYNAGLYGTRGYEMIAGMWTCYHTQNTLFQFNEVAYTVNETQNGISGDSMAFDVDLGTQGNHIFQYNYTHHNEGGVLMIMPRAPNTPTTHDFYKTTIYRYNISVNDARNTAACVQLRLYPVPEKSTAHVYNNVFYSTLPEGYKFTDVFPAFYRNNIFHVKKAIYPTKPLFENNAYFDHVPEVTDANKVVANPQFVSPFPQGAGGDGDNPANTDIFKLAATSPLINAGKAITVTPAALVDYWGTPLANKGLPDIGAFEHPSGGTLPAAPTAAAPVRYDDPHNPPTVTYGGTWNTTTAEPWAYHNNTITKTSVANSWVEVKFTGTNISLYGYRGPSAGKAKITIDEEPNMGAMDCYWPVDEYRVELHRITGLAANMEHTIRFTLDGKNPLSTSTGIYVDYFEKAPGTPPALPVVTRIDDTAGVKAGVWQNPTLDINHYGKTRAVSYDNNSTLTFTFTGTGVRVFGPMASDRGKYTVKVNNNAPVLVDQFSPVTYSSMIDFRQKQFELHGLAPNTTHTLVITCVDTSPTKKVVIDWIEALVGGAPPAPVIVDTTNTAPSLSWSGSWGHAGDSLYYNNTKSTANFHGASVEMSFTGTGAKLFVRKGPNLGKLNISVNGGAPTLVDCNATTNTYQFKIFEISGLPTGQVNKIKATVYDPTNTYKYVGVDYFEYQP